MMKKWTLLLGTAIILMGCEKKEVTIRTEQSMLNFAFVDEQDNNILDEQAFYGLRLYYIVDGVEKKVRKYSEGNSNGIRLVYMPAGKFKDQPIVHVWLNDEEKSDITYTHLKWGLDESRTYILKTAYSTIGDRRFPSKLWLDDELVWDSSIEEAFERIDGFLIYPVIEILK